MAVYDCSLNYWPFEFSYLAFFTFNHGVFVMKKLPIFLVFGLALSAFGCAYIFRLPHCTECHEVRLADGYAV